MRQDDGLVEVEVAAQVLHVLVHSSKDGPNGRFRNINFCGNLGCLSIKLGLVQFNG